MTPPASPARLTTTSLSSPRFADSASSQSDQSAGPGGSAGPAQAIGSLPNARRRSLIVILLMYSATVIFASAEPFAHSLEEIGREFGISEFFLIQWLAPLAS